MLEGEHIALQKRFKEQEAKLVNNDKAVTAARQSLTQAQNRSSEWEIRAKEYEGQLELTKTKLEHAEQTQSQINADYSLVKMQLEEREADERLAKVRLLTLFRVSRSHPVPAGSRRSTSRQSNRPGSEGHSSPGRIGASRSEQDSGQANQRQSEGSSAYIATRLAGKRSL